MTCENISNSNFSIRNEVLLGHSCCRYFMYYWRLLLYLDGRAVSL